MPDMIFLLLVALILSFWVYRNAIRRFWYLFILRTGGIFLLLLFAFKPVFHKTETIPTHIAVLLDRSASMGYPDKAQFQETILNKLRSLTLSNVKFTFYSFDTTLYSGIKKDFSGRTAIGKSISTIREKYVIMISDGLNNVGTNPREISKKVLILVPPARQSIVQDLRYRPVVVEGSDDTLNIKIGKRGKLELFRDTKKIFERNVKKGEVVKIVEKYEFPGLYTYRLRFNGKDLQTFSVHVVKRGKKVLVLSSHPDVNIRFIRMFLESRGNISSDFVVNTGKGFRVFKRNRVSDLDTLDLTGYDFYILIDPEAGRVPDSRALFMFSRKPSPEILKKLFGIPYFANRIRGEIYPVYRDSILNPISYVWKLNGYPPAAITFLNTRNFKVPLVFFVGDRAFVMSGDLYLIALYNFTLYSRIFDEILSKLMPEGNFYVEIPGNDFVSGERVEITAFAYDRFGNAIDSLFPVVDLNGEKHEMLYIGEGKYRADLVVQDTGKISGKVIFKSASGVLKTEPFRIHVRPFEEETPSPDVDLMYLKRTGRVLASFTDLQNELKKIRGEKYEKKFNMRGSSLALLFAILLLSLEWFLRRKNGVV